MVGQRYQLSWNTRRLNRVGGGRREKIRMGHKLKIIPGPFRGDHLLDRYEAHRAPDGSFVKNYASASAKTAPLRWAISPSRTDEIDPTY